MGADNPPALLQFKHTSVPILLLASSCRVLLRRRPRGSYFPRETNEGEAEKPEEGEFGRIK